MVRNGLVGAAGCIVHHVEGFPKAHVDAVTECVQVGIVAESNRDACLVFIGRHAVVIGRWAVATATFGHVGSHNFSAQDRVVAVGWAADDGRAALFVVAALVIDLKLPEGHARLEAALPVEARDVVFADDVAETAVL
jgi:hypothetical protein